MSMASKGFNGVVVPLFEEMLLQVQGEGSANPAESQHTLIVVPSSSHTPLITQTYRKRNRHETMVPQPSSPTHTLVAVRLSMLTVWKGLTILSQA